MAGAMLAPRTFEAASSVLVEPRKVDPTGTLAVVSGLPTDTNVVDTQARLIASPTVALRVVRELKLEQDADFAPKRDDASAKPGQSASVTGATDAETGAVETLLKRVSVMRSGLTYVIDIKARARSGDLAARIANSFARNYIALTNESKNDATQAAAGFVEQGATKLREQALRDDQALQAYRVAHNLMSADGSTLAERQISDLSTQIAQAKSTLAQEQGRYNAALTQIGRGGAADVNAVLSSETIRQLRTQEATASGQLATLEARYGDLHPDVISARNNLADIRRHITAERDRILSGLKANVQVAQSGLASLQASYNQIQGSLASNNTAMTGMSDLQRKADASASVYSAFLERAKQAAAQVQSPAPDATISSVAREPIVPVWPNLPLTVLLGLSVSLAAGAAGIALAEYLDRTVHNREEMETLVGVHYAGAVPAVRRAQKGEISATNYLLERPYSLFAEALRNIVSYIELTADDNARVVAITSSLPREGKTTTAVCLARMLAMSGRKVVLVDGDFRRRSATSLLAPKVAPEELTAGGVSANWMQRLVKDTETELAFLPAPGDGRALTQLTVEDAQQLFNALRQHFDYVIVDTAPVLGLAEARVLTRAADAVMLVVRWQNTSSRAALAAATVLRECQANVIGGLFSMIEPKQYAATGQADSFAYHKRFSSYYID